MVVFVIFSLVIFFAFSYERMAGSSEANSRSVILVNAINNYRAGKSLGAIVYSESMAYVSQHHVDDSEINSPAGGSCNAHSWSNDGPWTGVCYTSDHAKKQEMWDKPREITSYSGNGYEISVTGGSVTTWEARATQCVNSWDGSTPHREVILNQGSWTTAWGGVGCAMAETYCHCWFGREVDSGRTFSCNGKLATNYEEVCGGIGVGICQKQDTCKCFPGYMENSFVGCAKDNSRGGWSFPISLLSFIVVFGVFLCFL